MNLWILRHHLLYDDIPEIGVPDIWNSELVCKAERICPRNIKELGWPPP